MSRQTPAPAIDGSFGFIPQESAHHFLVTIPKGSVAPIQISEHFAWDPESGSSPVALNSRADGQVRVLLARPK